MEACLHAGRPHLQFLITYSLIYTKRKQEDLEMFLHTVGDWKLKAEKDILHAISNQKLDAGEALNIF